MWRSSFARIFLLRIAQYHYTWICIQICIGFFSGYLFGYSVKYSEYDIIEKNIVSGPIIVSLSNGTKYDSVFVRCAVIISKDQNKKAKYVAAIKDTYAKDCSETVYFTHSSDLQKEFSEHLEIVFIDSWQSHYYWTLYKYIIRYMLERTNSKVNNTWTVIGDEQLYVVVRNLREYLKIHSSPLVLAKKMTMSSLLSYLPPFRSQTALLTRSGIVFSNDALRAVINDKCSGVFFPLATEVALAKCLSIMDVPTIDPHDDEGVQLLNYEPLLELIKEPRNIINEVNYKETVKAKCCSDGGITFGSLNYKQHRLIDFLVNNLKVMG